MLFHTDNKPIRIGTDCSGIEAPIIALEQLKIPFTHEFSSEIDQHCISTIKANFNPKIIFGNMIQRKLKDIPNIDMYVCGFPCQPFSVAGYRQGKLDPRGTIFYECLKVIRYKKPIIFLLENVKGLLSIDNGNTFKEMIYLLENIKLNDKPIYNIYWKVLNTADYGIPQSRKRLFMIGIKRNKQINNFEWPIPIECQSLHDFVDWNDNSKNELPAYFYASKMDEIINPNSIFINIGYKKYSHNNADKICPCLTTNTRHFYCLPLKRFMNINEYLKIQGFPTNYKINVSKYQFQKQIGNSMSVNVLIYLFKNIFQTIQSI